MRSPVGLGALVSSSKPAEQQYSDKLGCSGTCARFVVDVLVERSGLLLFSTIVCGLHVALKLKTEAEYLEVLFFVPVGVMQIHPVVKKYDALWCRLLLMTSICHDLL